MNKGIGGEQPQLRNGWFNRGDVEIDQPMNFQAANGQWTQKGIQKILEEQNLWPVKGLRLECPKPKCFNCQVAADCEIRVKGHKCDLYKTPKQHSGTAIYTKNWKCDACALRERRNASV